MALLDTVKRSLGIYYTEQNKDAEIQTIIDGAKAFLLSAGVPSADLADDSESPQAVQAVIIYAKMAVNTDPAEMRMNPMLIALVAQMRNKPVTEEPEDTTDTEQTNDSPDVSDQGDEGNDDENQG